MGSIQMCPNLFYIWIREKSSEDLESFAPLLIKVSKETENFRLIRYYLSSCLKGQQNSYQFVL